MAMMNFYFPQENCLVGDCASVEFFSPSEAFFSSPVEANGDSDGE